MRCLVISITTAVALSFTTTAVALATLAILAFLTVLARISITVVAMVTLRVCYTYFQASSMAAGFCSCRGAGRSRDWISATVWRPASCQRFKMPLQ